MNQKTILLIDDDSHILLAVKFHIPDIYKVQTAKNGLEALYLLKYNRLPDLIISDINMPEMDGIQLLHCISQNRILRKIPMIFISGESLSRKQIFELYKTGIKAIYQKPVNNIVIKNILNSYL